MTAQQTIPLSKLVRSARNVRKTGGTSIADLSASIAAHGLLQNLIVLPAAGDRYEVVAGARRLAALEALAKAGRIPADFDVPCQIADPSTDGEVSLAENVVRQAMHPADQFDAFQHLVDAGLKPTDIAARFGVSEHTVAQRLKLARVAPDIVAAYRDDKVGLDSLEAFAITDDHEAQLRHWKRCSKNHWEMEPAAVRRALTKGEVETDDNRFRLVGAETYEAAGGRLRRDLFDEAGGGYVLDVQLLDNMAQNALAAHADKIKEDEGWAWAEARLSFNHEDERKSGLGRFGNEYDRPTKFTAAQKATAGIVVTINPYSRDPSRSPVQVERGFIRKADAKAARAASPKEQKLTAPKKKPVKGEISIALLHRLAAQHTMAIRAELLARSDVALRAMVHWLALQIIYPDGTGAGVSNVKLSAHRRDADARAWDPDIDKSPAGAHIASQCKTWRERLPKKSGELWGWLAGVGDDTCLSLLAFCTAQRVMVTDFAHDPKRYPETAAELTGALDLDMRRWWKPTVDSYLGALSRDQILATLKDAGLEPQIAHEGLQTFKAKDLAKRAEQLLAHRMPTWLPPMLRGKVAAPVKPAAAVAPAKKPAKAAAKKAAKGKRK